MLTYYRIKSYFD